jgi:hypothetical protein
VTPRGTTWAVVVYAALFVLLDVVERLPSASIRVPIPLLITNVVIEGVLVWGLVRSSALAWALGLGLAVLGIVAFVVDVPRDAEVITILAVSVVQVGILLTAPLREIVAPHRPTPRTSV